MKGQSRSRRLRGGHVQVRVADLDRAIVFYRDTFGFELVADGRPAGLGVVFLEGRREPFSVLELREEQAEAPQNSTQPSSVR
jgi:catechol 2,3-dioxygenase-like lactoylglutathione lyase family enzyme